MLSLFRRKPKTPQEEFERVLLDAFDNLKKATSRPDALSRRMYSANALGALVAVLREYYPNVEIEQDSVAINVLANGGDAEHWDAVEADIAHISDQIMKCSRETHHRIFLVHYLFAPQKVKRMLDAVNS